MRPQLSGFMFVTCWFKVGPLNTLNSHGYYLITSQQSAVQPSDLYAAQRDDGGLGAIDQRRGEDTADAADVAQRQCAAGHDLLRQPPRRS